MIFIDKFEILPLYILIILNALFSYVLSMLLYILKKRPKGS